jgi:hypothetical protein
MKNPASRGATAGLSKIVSSQADSHGYALTPGALQAHRLIQRGLTPAVANAVAALAYAVPESWRTAR